MKRLIVASTRQNAGKTGIIVGIGRVLRGRIGYMKPFGDRLLYRKKRFWDYDSALVTNLFHLREDPTYLSLGFDHSKLSFMHDEHATRKRLLDLLSDFETKKDIVFFEGGRDLGYGASVFLDAFSVSRYVGGRIILVVSGNEDAVMDDLAFFRKRVVMNDVELEGIIVNRVPDPENFRSVYLPRIDRMGIPVLGLIPRQKELLQFTIAFLAELLFAKVLTGGRYLNRNAGNVFVGTMATDSAVGNPHFHADDKVLVTGGDRTDMIMEALKGSTAAVVLTGNIAPAPAVVSEAGRQRVPLLLVSSDTYQIARQIDGMEPLLTKEDKPKISIWEKLIRTHVNVKRIPA
jgi:hypothetical protein